MSRSIESPAPTERLEELLQSDVLRRGRFLGGTGRVRDGAAALNVVISEVAFLHRLRGLDVRWASARCGIVDRSRAIREALHLLLDNVARQADATVSIAVERRGHWAHLAVAQRADERHEPREEGPDIQLARRLLVGVGGTLRLDPSYVTGTRFDLRLPLVGTRRSLP